MLKLQVYVSDQCWTCEEASRVVAEVTSQFPEVRAELIDLQDAGRPAAVFAVPTYVLNGQIIFLGNPTRQELVQRLMAASNDDGS